MHKRTIACRRYTPWHKAALVATITKKQQRTTSRWRTSTTAKRTAQRQKRCTTRIPISKETNRSKSKRRQPSSRGEGQQEVAAREPMNSPKMISIMMSWYWRNRACRKLLRLSTSILMKAKLRIVRSEWILIIAEGRTPPSAILTFLSRTIWSRINNRSKRWARPSRTMRIGWLIYLMDEKLLQDTWTRSAIQAKDKPSWKMDFRICSINPNRKR